MEENVGETYYEVPPQDLQIGGRYVLMGKCIEHLNEKVFILQVEGETVAIKVEEREVPALGDFVRVFGICQEENNTKQLKVELYQAISKGITLEGYEKLKKSERKLMHTTHENGEII